MTYMGIGGNLVEKGKFSINIRNKKLRIIYEEALMWFYSKELVLLYNNEGVR